MEPELDEGKSPAPPATQPSALQSVSGAAVSTDRIYGVQAFPLSEGVRCLLVHDATPLESGSLFFLFYIRESIGSGFFSSLTCYGLITFTSGH